MFTFENFNCRNNIPNWVYYFLLQCAEFHYLEAARLDPKRADVHSNLGSLLLREGRTSQAIIQYEEALRIDPSLTEAAENLRVAKESDNRFQARGRP